jgi:hypothetical protein
LNPPVVTIAGDLFDGLNVTSFVGWRRQYEANWQRYNGTRYLSDIYGEVRVVLESAGNHDLYSVGGDDDIRNRYRHYTMGPDEEFGVRGFLFDNCSVPIRLILFNPERPPTTSGPPGIFPAIHADALEVLDGTISDDRPNVIVCHFPITHLWAVNSTTGGRGAQAVLHRAHLFLAGHVHPFWNEIARKQDTLSIIVTAFFEYPYAVLAWVDSGGTGVQVVDSHEESTIMITYPLPKAQLTGRSHFNATAFPIRVVSFTDTPVYLTVYIDDRFVGTLTYLRTLRRNVHFYSLNVSVTAGTHLLRVGPKEVEFFVGGQSEPTTEIANTLFSPEFAMIGPAAFIIYMCMFVVPWWQAMPEALDNFRLVMFGDPTAMPIPWPQYILLGPLYMLSRLRRTPNDLYIWCVIMAVIFIVFPVYTTWLDDNLAIAWYWGQEVDGTWSQYGMLGVCVLIYEIAFALEMFHIIGIFYENDRGTPLAFGQIVEIVLLSIPVLIGVGGWGMLAYHAGQWWTVLTSTISIVMIATIVRVVACAFQ